MSSAAETVLARVLERMKISPERFARMTERNEAGNFLRGKEDVKLRTMVWAAMREQHGPIRLSLPEIAAAFNTGHSTILTALQRVDKLPA